MMQSPDQPDLIVNSGGYYLLTDLGSPDNPLCPITAQLNSCIAQQFPYYSLRKFFSASFNFLLIVKYTQMNRIWWPRLNTSSLVVNFMFVPLSISFPNISLERKTFCSAVLTPWLWGIAWHKSEKLCGLKHRKPVARWCRILKIFRFPLAIFTSKKPSLIP